MKRFAFVMDPLERLSLEWDTSLCLVRELNRRGYETFLFPASSLAQTGDEVWGAGRRVRPPQAQRYQRGPEERWNLCEFDAVLIRKDPPFDGGYLALTYLLEPLAKKIPVINHPRGIRNANEKLFGLQLKRWSPPTVVTASTEEIISFQRKIRFDLVIKPLYDKGGKNVFLLSKKEKEVRTILKKATAGESKPVVAQEFVPVPRGKGDKRILLWKDKILGTFERIPLRGEFRSNLSLGAKFKATTLTAHERKLVRELAPLLVKEGLYWTGIDVRAGRLLEVNVTSPAGLVELDRLYGGQTTSKLADDLEAIESDSNRASSP